MYGIFSLSPRLLIKHYFTYSIQSSISDKVCQMSKCQSVKESEVVVTLSNAQGSKSQSKKNVPSEIIASNNIMK